MMVSGETLLARWAQREKAFAQDDYKGPLDGPMVTQTVGTLPVLICAVHATRHFWGPGKFKPHDKWTGGLATVLGSELGASIICRRRMGVYADDEKVWDAVREHIETYKPKFIIDLHASVSACPWDVVFGTSDMTLSDEERTQITLVRNIAKDCGFSHRLEWLAKSDVRQLEMLLPLRAFADREGLTHKTNILSYAALSAYSVTTRAMKLEVPTLQVEMRPQVRDPELHANRALQMLHVLRRGILRMVNKEE